MKFSMETYGIYYYCNIANNAIDRFDLTRNLEPLINAYSDEEPANFPKFSALHEYCTLVISSLLGEDFLSAEDIEIGKDSAKLSDCTADEIERLCGELKLDTWLLSIAAKQYSMNLSFREWLSHSFRTFDTVMEAVEQFTSDNEFEIEVITDKIVTEMFYILFGNRDFLLRLNSTIAGGRESVCKRASVPQWVKNAVFYRDKGKCVFCGKDLSGTLNIPDSRDVQYDHIVPLEDGGLNDVTNIQLTCSHCNQVKATLANTGRDYYFWYDM